MSEPSSPLADDRNGSKADVEAILALPGFRRTFSTTLNYGYSELDYGGRFRGIVHCRLCPTLVIDFITGSDTRPRPESAWVPHPFLNQMLRMLPCDCRMALSIQRG
jgi:hypothetical protein